MNELFDRYCLFDRVAQDGTHHRTTTRHVRVEPGVHAEVPALVRSVCPEGPVAIVLDANTRAVAGDDVIRAAQRAELPHEIIELKENEGEEVIVCTDARIAEVETLLREGSFAHAIAVGAGTINDVVKMASFKAGCGYTTVGTAPSMNGYTSSIAAILSSGVKTTQPCHAPLIALADPRVMAEAPYRMIASGLGDLYSKPVSNADWRLSHRLLGTWHSDLVMEIVESGAALLDGVAPRLPARDEDAVARLTGAIMISGLAMQAAGTSGPASGGEHLISHFVDMEAYAFGAPHDFHGCQVAVGTVTTSKLYERVLGLDPATIDPDAAADRHIEWDAYEPVLRERFGKLSEAVIGHARKMYPTASDVRTRLARLKREWHDVAADVSVTLRTSEDLAEELRSAHVPTLFPEIGVVEERARRAVLHCKDIRARYTILHLAHELGVLPDFVDETVPTHFG